jgi:hypothetical protein
MFRFWLDSCYQGKMEEDNKIRQLHRKIATTTPAGAETIDRFAKSRITLCKK